MQNEGFRVDYERLPGASLARSLSPFPSSRADSGELTDPREPPHAVTDEQSPIPGVFSRIERRMSSALTTARDKENFSAAWNCQMGASALPFNLSCPAY